MSFSVVFERKIVTIEMLIDVSGIGIYFGFPEGEICAPKKTACRGRSTKRLAIAPALIESIDFSDPGFPGVRSVSLAPERIISSGVFGNRFAKSPAFPQCMRATQCHARQTICLARSARKP